MKFKEIKNYFRIIILNYKNILKKIFYLFIYLTVVVFSSLIITLPLWYTATLYSNIYTTTVLISIIIILGIALLKNIKKWIVLKQEQGLSTKNIIFIPIKKTGIILLFVSGIYGILVTYIRSYLFLAIILTIIYLTLLGYYIFIFKKINESH